jgi:hypothetical protein
MAERLTIVRAFDGEPLKRVLVDTGRTVAYVANPEFMDRVKSGDSAAVGFPWPDVYEFDSKAFSKLSSQWKRQDQELPWNELKRLSPAGKE